MWKLKLENSRYGDLDEDCESLWECTNCGSRFMAPVDECPICDGYITITGVQYKGYRDAVFIYNPALRMSDVRETIKRWNDLRETDKDVLSARELWEVDDEDEEVP